MLSRALAYVGGWQPVKPLALPTGHSGASRVRAVNAEQDYGAVTRRRIAAWVQHWMDTKKREGVEMSRAELARRLGVDKSTVTRVLDGDRLGLDVFLRIRRLLNRSADTLLDDSPPGWKP